MKTFSHIFSIRREYTRRPIMPREQFLLDLEVDMCRADVYAEWMALREMLEDIPIHLALATAVSEWLKEAEPVEPVTVEPEMKLWQKEVDKFIFEMGEAMICLADEREALAMKGPDAVLRMLQRARDLARTGILMS